LTKDGGIAAIAVGSKSCKPDYYTNNMDENGMLTNCTLEITTKVNETYSQVTNQECIDFFREAIPGSNLYFCVWGSLLAAINIALRWKAAQALQFAQTAQRQVTESTILEEQEEVEVEDDDDAI
jgi:hypothetical protein